MAISIRGSLLLTVGLLFCILGCARDRATVLIPDHVSPPTEVHEIVDAEVSFEQNLLPILTARCALAGCHVADGPHGLDFRTYESFVAGGEHGPAFIAGNAEESEIIEQIVSGNMPVGGPPLSATDIQLFVDWINQQETQDHIEQREHGDEHMDDAHDMDGGHEEDMDDDHEIMNGDQDDAHDMDDAHDDDDDEGHDDDDDNHENDN